MTYTHNIKIMILQKDVGMALVYKVHIQYCCHWWRLLWKSIYAAIFSTYYILFMGSTNTLTVLETLENPCFIYIHDKQHSSCAPVSSLEMPHTAAVTCIPVYSGKQRLSGDFSIFSSNRSFLFKNRMMAVRWNHRLLQIESNSIILSFIRF